MRRELRKPAVLVLKNPLNFNVTNILFHHTWQRQMHGKKSSKNWNRDGTYFRSQILKDLIMIRVYK